MISAQYIHDTYHALRLHFTTNYDFHKYRGQIKATSQLVENSKNFPYFKLAKLLKDQSKTDIISFFLAGMIDDPKKWITDYLENKSMADYFDFLKREESRSYTLRTDLRSLARDYSNPIWAFYSKDGQYPGIIKSYYAKKISPETVIMLDNKFNLFKTYETRLIDTLIWPKTAFILKKYAPFITYDVDTFEAILENESKIWIENEKTS